MERKITITQCDVCGRKVNEDYATLLRSHQWTKYKLIKEWCSGGHKGDHNTDIIVCNKCDNNGNGIRYFFYNILKPFLKRMNGEI